MPRHPRLKRKGNNWYFRAKVPHDVRDLIGKAEVVRSLKTEDYRKACEKERLESIRFDQEIADARRRKSGQGLVTHLPDHEAERLALLWLHQMLELDGEERRERGDWPDEEDGITDELERLETARLKADYGPVAWDVDTLLAEQKLHVARASEPWRKVAFHLLRAREEFFKSVLARNAGKWPKLPDLPAAKTTGTGAGTTLEAILEKWIGERRPPSKTESEWRAAVRRWGELVGDLPITQVTRRHVADFKDDLLRLPARAPREIAKLPAAEQIGAAKRLGLPTLSVGAVKKQLGAVASLFSFAVDNAYVDANPAAGIKIRETKNPDERRLPYDGDDLSRIFGCPIYTSADRPRGGAGEAAYWLPLLGLYTGARLDELGQLRVSDVKQEGGVSFLDINTIDEGKRLKAKTSRRNVPLHPVLIRCGFLDYVGGLPKGGSLFPELRPDKHGKPTGNWSKWWGRYAREVIGIADGRKVFHSFRHSFKDACRAARIEEEVHDALTGHASGGGVGRRYGAAGVPLKVLAEAVERLDYPAVNPPAWMR